MLGTLRGPVVIATVEMFRWVDTMATLAVRLCGSFRVIRKLISFHREQYRRNKREIIPVIAPFN